MKALHALVKAWVSFKKWQVYSLECARFLYMYITVFNCAHATDSKRTQKETISTCLNKDYFNKKTYFLFSFWINLFFEDVEILLIDLNTPNGGISRVSMSTSCYH